MRVWKTLILILAVGFLILTVGFVYSRLIVHQEFGPSSMLAALFLTVSSITLVVSYVLVDGRHKDKVVGFWMILISSIGTYFVADLLAGFLLIRPLSPQLIPDPVRHHKLVPNAHAKFEQKDFSYIQRNNELGLRGVDVSAEKPDATYRIITLGDSFTMGKGVEDDQTFSVLLESILNIELGNCDSEFERVEVLNAGVDSYSPILSYLYLTHRLKDLDPDMVLLNLDNSDLIQEMAYRGIAVHDDQGNIVGVPGGESKRHLSTKFRDWVENNLYITRLLLFYTNKWLGYKDLTVKGVVSRANAEVIAHTLESDQIDRTQQWNDIFESLVSIREFTNQRSIKFLVSVYPWAHQVSDDEWVPGRNTYMNSEERPIEEYDRKIAVMAANFGIEVISLYDYFRKYSGEDSLYFDFDPHFTEQGHRVMATGLARLIVDEGYTAEWCR